MSVLSPNMSLVLSTVNVDSGLNWEQNLNSSLTILDGHTHSSGSGVQIQPTGLNINSALTFNNQQATNLQAVVFTAQASLVTLGAIYSKGADLYYNDANGNVIQITSGGTVNATSSGISSGSATASFVSSVLVVNAASNTPANIQGGSLLLGNNVAASKFLTLAPPNAMGANYSLTLPSIPAQTNVVTLDTSGNISSTTWNTVANNRTRSSASSTATQGNVAISASCGVRVDNATTFTAIPNLSVTITTGGSPVWVGLISDGSGNASYLGAATTSLTSAVALFRIKNGSTEIAQTALENIVAVSGLTSLAIQSPVTGLSVIDLPAAGTITYTVEGKSVNSNCNYICDNAKLVAYEI